MRIERIEAIPADAAAAAYEGRHRLYHPSLRGVDARLQRTEAWWANASARLNEDALAQAEILRLIRDELAPVLIGRDAFLVESCWQAMQPATRDILRDRRLAMRAIACIDARRCGTPWARP